jgi:hypothetical protein
MRGGILSPVTLVIRPMERGFESMDAFLARRYERSGWTLGLVEGVGDSKAAHLR